jgi:alpha-galactosidase
MPKITMIGAGSTVFCKNLLGDILSYPELAASEIALMDIDPERLRVSELMAHKVAQAVGARPTITAHADRRAALDGADYAISMIQVGGYEPSTVVDFEIPKKYGLRQTIADTLGIGGIFRALRTIPVLLDICADMEELCPDVEFLQYVNPMAANCWACLEATDIKLVGLCHSVQGTAHHLARMMGLEPDKLRYQAAGINHNCWYLDLRYEGEDAYPLLWEAYQNEDIRRRDPVRFEMFRRLGYFVTESSEHFSEYCPHFIRRDRPELIERFHVPLDEYIRRCISQNAGWARDRERMLNDENLTVHRSMEYGSQIIHAIETGEPTVIYGNVLNDGLIDNLPDGCCVEVPCLVDGAGVQPTKIGWLPPQLAAVCQTNINVQSLIVAAALSGQREHIYHAAMVDPHTSAELTLDEIWAMVDELIDVHTRDGFLPHFDDESPVCRTYAWDAAVRTVGGA